MIGAHIGVRRCLLVRRDSQSVHRLTDGRPACSRDDVGGFDRCPPDPHCPVGGHPIGGPKGIRTPDLLAASQTLYQLSYGPVGGSV